MYSIKQAFKREPAAISTFLVGVLNVGVLFGLDVTPEQVAGINVAAVAGLNLLYVRPSVEPTDG